MPDRGGVDEAVVTLALCGDVMLGRGVDQILPHPGDPRLRERYLHDARRYVDLAEKLSGQVPRPVGFDWPWGDALRTLDEAAPDVRVVNLETAVTRSPDFAPGKAVHYRMSPDNLPCLAAARPDVSALANNHVLDFGTMGLVETLRVLAGAGLPVAGAGLDLAQAQRPVAVPLPGGGRVLAFSLGMPSSGIPHGWAATSRRPGVDLVADLGDRSAAQVTDRVDTWRQAGDLVVVSLHWGSNWGWGVDDEQVRFAHRLVDGGVDVVHGHSSHHPRPVEVYRDRLVLYGCGDFVDDYEGIEGYEEFRDDLRALYLVTLEAGNGRLVGLRMETFQAVRMRLQHASEADVAWLGGVLDRESRRFGTGVAAGPGRTLTLTGG